MWAVVGVLIAVLFAVSPLIWLSGNHSKPGPEPGTTPSPSPTAFPSASPTRLPSASSTLSSSTDSQPTAKPRSNLVDLTLPPGTQEIPADNPLPGSHERWSVPKDYQATIDYLEPQLPLEKANGNRSWCDGFVNTSSESSQWSWGTADDRLIISVAGPRITGSGDSHVSVDLGPDSSPGADGGCMP